MRSLIPLLALTFAACSTDATTSATDRLLVSATSGAEEAIAWSTYGETAGETDPNRPGLFRECDAQGTYIGLVEKYDADGDGAIDSSEADSVDADYEAAEDSASDGPDGDRPHGDGHGGHGGHPGGDHRRHLIGLVYDTDLDGELSTEEKVDLFADFTVRCETLHQKLLDQFDADGDGTLSDTEIATAEATLEAEREAAHAAMEAECDATTDTDAPAECDRPEGAPEGDGPHGDHHGDGAHPDGRPGGPPDLTSVPPPLSAYDTDGDGTWDDDELATFRAELRDRIRSGEPLVPPPPTE